MTDDVAKSTQNNDAPKMEGGITGKGFKPGYDPRRWLKGRPHAPKDASKLLNSLIWDVFSEELENPKKAGEFADRLRLALRTATTSRNQAAFLHLLDRVAGKVTERVDLTSGGEKLKGFAIVNPNDWDKDE